MTIFNSDLRDEYTRKFSYLHLAHIQPEVELLLALVRSTGDAKTAWRIRQLLEQELHWEYLLETAFHHRVALLVYSKLQRIGHEAVPQAVMQHLSDQSAATAYHNLYLAGEIRKILQLFEAHAIPAIPFKGPVLAAVVYGDLSLRPCDDLDILIHRKNFPQARDLLITQGYQTDFHPNSPQETAYLRQHHDYVFLRSNGRLMVELQWGLLQKPFTFPLDIDQLWERCETRTIVGKAVPILAPEDQLLILCVHGAKHLWERLIWVCDVDRLVSWHSGMEWELVRQRARAWGAERMLMTGLLLTHTLLGTVLPDAVLRHAQADPVAQALATQICAGLCRDPGVPPAVITEAPLFYLRMLERRQQRTWLWLHLLPALLHPLRLARRYKLHQLRHLLEC